MKDGKLLTVENADAKEVRNFVLDEKYKENSWRYKANNKLTAYMSPGHFFLRLECDDCDKGQSYSETKGFYPNGRLMKLREGQAKESGTGNADILLKQHL
ncbi:MAG: hypothetical protein ACK4OM_06160 [Alphaproteobacteria bacterium]